MTIHTPLPARLLVTILALVLPFSSCSSSSGETPGADGGTQGGAGAGGAGAGGAGAVGGGAAADGAAADAAGGSAPDSGSGGDGGSAGQGADAHDPALPDAAQGDAPPTGDAGSACRTIATLDRSCSTEGDCLAVRHVSNCCGQEIFIGIRVTESARFQGLEAACDSGYPACGCAAGPPMTEDGSTLLLGGPKPGVTCLKGTCTTFAAVCGHVCEGGTSCFACADHLVTYAACSTRCNTPSDCKDPNLSTCQSGPSGRFCAAAGVSCNTR